MSNSFVFGIYTAGDFDTNIGIRNIKYNATYKEDT